jgi:hypothetical protein
VLPFGFVRFRLALPAFLACLVAAGCSGDPGDCGTFRGDAGEQVWLDARGAVATPGALSVQVRPPASGLCRKGFNYPKITAAWVVAPDGGTLPSTWRMVPGPRVEVAFEAPAPGEYEVWRRATPDPKTGRPEQAFPAHVWVGRDLRDAGQVELPLPCDRVERTSLGTLICDGVVFRGVTKVQDLPYGFSFTASGAAVWGINLYYGDAVARWVDTGSGPLLDGGTLRGGPPDAGRAYSMFATADELLIRRERRVERYASPRAGGASLQLLGTIPVGSGTLVFRAGAEVLVDELVSDGGWLPTLCALRVDGGTLERSSAPCALTYAVGVTPEGVWSGGSAGTEVVLHAPRSGEVALIGRLPSPPGSKGIEPDYPYSASPFVLREITSQDPERPGRYLLFPTARGDQLWFDVAPLRGRLRGAGGGMFWTETADGWTVVTFQ